MLCLGVRTLILKQPEASIALIWFAIEMEQTVEYKVQVKTLLFPHHLQTVSTGRR